MDISIDERWAGFIQQSVQTGRFTSAAALIAEADVTDGDLGGVELDAYFDGLTQDLYRRAG